MFGLLQSHTSAAAPVVDTGQAGPILPHAHELTLLEGMQSLTLASVGPVVAASSPALPIRWAQPSGLQLSYATHHSICVGNRQA